MIVGSPSTKALQMLKDWTRWDDEEVSEAFLPQRWEPMACYRYRTSWRKR